MSDRYFGDFTVGSTIRIKFNTFNQSLIPTTPSVTPTFAVYKNSVGESTTNITTAFDYDGKAGFHMISIDTSADPTFYVAGEDYDIVFTAGTVDGKDLTRVILSTFSLENRSRKSNVIQIADQTVNASSTVTFPSLVANETTVGTRATQTSVNLIPTNPLLSNDTRLNNLDFSIAAINTAIGNLNNLSALINIYGSPLLEIPDSGTTVYAFTIVVRDNEGKLNNLDASPTLTAANALGTSRSANLSVVSNPSVGRYTFTYSVASNHDQESLRIAASGTVSTEARYIEWIGSVVNYDTLTTLQQVQTTVNSIDSRLPSQPTSVNDIPTVIQIWSALTTYAWPNNSFGAQVVIGFSSQREIAITGSHHVASVVHSVEPNAIPENAFQSDAISARVLNNDAVLEIQSGLALQSTLLIVDKSTKLIPGLF